MADDLSPRQESEWAAMDLLRHRAKAYKLSANQPAFQEMLQDIAFYCRANETCIVKDNNGRIDEIATFILEGRREVWLRIQAHLNLTAKQLFLLYTGRPFDPGDNDDRRDSDIPDYPSGDPIDNSARYTMVSGES